MKNPQTITIELKQSGKSVKMNGEYIIGPDNSSTPVSQSGWSFAASQKIHEAIQEIPYYWVDTNDNVLDDESKLPFKWGRPANAPGGIAQDEQVFNTSDVIARIMTDGLSLYSHAGLFKYKGPTVSGRGSTLITLTWLNPAVLEPVTTGLELGMVPRSFTYSSDVLAGSLDVNNVLYISNLGVAENWPLKVPPAKAAKIAALVLSQFDHVSSTILEDLIPVTTVQLQHYDDDQAKNITEAITRIVNNSRYRASSLVSGAMIQVRKILGLPPGTQIDTLSFTPDQVSQYATVIPDKRQEIAAIYGIPDSILTGEHSAVAGVSSHYSGFIRKVAARFQAIADQLNRDPDIMKTGYRLMVDEASIPVPAEEQMVSYEKLARAVAMGFDPQIVAENLNIPELIGVPVEIAAPSFIMSAQKVKEKWPEASEVFLQDIGMSSKQGAVSLPNTGKVLHQSYSGQNGAT